MSTHSSYVYRAILSGCIAAIATMATAQHILAQAPAARTTVQRAATAQPVRTKAVRAASVEGITQYDLANGMRVLLFPDQSKPSVTVNITYLVGSRHEGSGETGMAHFLEHLVFKGSPKHRDIPQELTEHGAQANGTTWYDRTNYYVTVPATDANLMWALDLESDRMVNSFIAKKDLESEMTVVRNEFESGENNPNNVLFQRTLSTAYLWHGYGRSTIGSRADLEGVKVDRLQSFYRKYYQPDNAILVIAGKFDEPKTLAMVERMFGRIPRPARKLEPTYTAEPTQDGERTVTLRRVGDVQLVSAAYHVPAGSHADLAALDVLTHVLGNAPSGRLYKALVESKKAASVGSFAFQLAEPGMLMAFAQVRTENSLDSARTVLLETVEKPTPATAEDVERAKAALLKNIELTLNSSENVGLELTEWASMGDWRLFFIHRDRIKKVTTADVDRVAAAYLKPSNRTLGLFYPTAKPDRAEIPVASDVGFLVRDYKGDTVAVAGEAFDASFVNLEARTIRSTLANGMRLTMVPKKTRGGSVFSRVYLRFGSQEALSGRTRVSVLTAQMLDKGTTTRTRQQLKDELDKLKAAVSISGQNISSQAIIETTRGNLPAVLRLVHEMMRHPSFDAKEFEQLKTQMLAQLESNKSEPNPLASVAYSRHMNPRPKGHPLYTPTLEEQIEEVKAVTLDQVKQFHSEL
ncbi:MAG: insulinase family protein, partial [Anaerolineae bacterium]|nr:insulinase family protein [Gemmatimonadaceae bacterium]